MSGAGRRIRGLARVGARAGDARTTKHDYDNGMTDKKKRNGKDGGVSKVKLAVGAASLFLFIIGVKRTYQMDEAQEAGEGGSGGKAAEGVRRKAPRAAR